MIRCSTPVRNTTFAILSAFFIAPLSIAAEWHVAVNGNDTNPGTPPQPLASIAAAQKKASPGDTILIHGGTYAMKESDIASRDKLIASLISIDKGGAKNKPIRYQAAPGERPVLDCAAVTPAGLRVSAIRVNASWVEIVGLEIIGLKVNASGHTQSICVENLGNHNVFQNLSMHDGEAIGLYITRGEHNLVFNCDAYRNHDGTSENRLGGNTDGFGCHPRNDKAEGNTFIGCRAWFNSDDGFDCINAPCPVTFVNCWSFYNGFSPDFKPLADGNGFKAGGYGISPDTQFPSPVPRHRVINCLAVRNRSNGFYANHHPGGVDWVLNRGYLNSINFNFLGRNQEGTSDAPGYGHRIFNNLSYRSRNGIQNLATSGNESLANEFDLSQQLTDADFLSLDLSSLTAPRDADGELPKSNFFSRSPGKVSE